MKKTILAAAMACAAAISFSAPASADSLKADLQKLADRWMLVPAGGGLELDEFAS